jgi:adenylate cyclase
MGSLVPAHSGFSYVNHRLFLAAKTSGNFTQQLILFFPARLERPGKDLLKMIAVIHGERAEGAEAALRCALAMFEALDGLNERLAGELETPLAIGIGIHTGQAIVGRMGPPKTPIISAVGDSVNTAARLEKTAKELSVPLVVSAETLRAAGLHTFATITQVSLRGRSATMLVSALDDASLRHILT